MDVNTVCTALADQVRAGVPSLNCFGHIPDSTPVPCFFTGEYDIEYDKATDHGMDEAAITCYVLVSRTDIRSAQESLSRFAAGSGPLSIKAAIETDRTLGGAVEDIRVIDFRTLGAEELDLDDRIGGVFTVRALAQSETE
ncbi:hypothetical protein [Spongiactinospora sp. TRM90649]|uniref:hypothetical protein n=1 Tax=Spongiactinospora sp. TRM90649 TaxID=3031114 RepID=UPI0023F7744E|nr:hypothetical protein [Spongiactinospora sp. TRM90649]MDF5755819.1 hypothetical protein [Spongiactinospora sp. TRM90649]